MGHCATHHHPALRRCATTPTAGVRPRERSRFQLTRQRRGDIHREKTAEERFHMLARSWPAYPVTPVARATTAEVRL